MTIGKCHEGKISSMELRSQKVEELIQYCHLASMIAESDSIYTVSYTHLDVYKRQQ